MFWMEDKEEFCLERDMVIADEYWFVLVSFGRIVLKLFIVGGNLLKFYS